MKERLRLQGSQLNAEVYKGATRAKEIAKFVCDRPLRIALAVGLAAFAISPVFLQK